MTRGKPRVAQTGNPVDNRPTIRMCMSRESFILLAGGRRTPAEVPVEVDGDEGLAVVVLGAMAVTP